MKRVVLLLALTRSVSARMLAPAVPYGITGSMEAYPAPGTWAAV